MKVTRVIAATVALGLMGSHCAFAAVDWASMDDATIQAEIANAQAELAKRSGSESTVDGAVLFDVEGVKATVQSYGVGSYMDDNDSLQLNFIVENNSGKDMEFYIEKVSINGWEVDHIGYIEIGAGHKAKGDFKLLLSDANISSIDEVETVEVSFNYADENYDYHYTDSITLNF